MMSPLEIRARREALGLSQAALAAILGAGQMAISRWETGTRCPRDPIGLHLQLCALEDALMDAVEVLIERVTDGDVEDTQILVYASQDAYETSEPDLSRRLPMETHRVAAAHAAMALREEDTHVALVQG